MEKRTRAPTGLTAPTPSSSFTALADPRGWERTGSRGTRARLPGACSGLPRLRGSKSKRCALTPPGSKRWGSRRSLTTTRRSLRRLDKPPIIIGHSFGGTVTQLLLRSRRRRGRVCLNSAVVKGDQVVPLTRVRSLFPVLDSPAASAHRPWDSHRQLHYAFAEHYSPQRNPKPLYDRCADCSAAAASSGTAPSRISRAILRRGGFQERRPCPLLFIAGGEDHVNPPAVNRSNYKRSRSRSDHALRRSSPTGSHFMLGLDDWQSIADLALAWAVNQTTPHGRAGSGGR